MAGGRKPKPGIMSTMVVAALVALCAMVAMAVGLVTDHWLEYRVSGLAIPSDQLGSPIYYDRDRGLIRTCFNSDDSHAFLQIHDDDVTDHTCLFEQGYELDSDSEDFGSNYDRRIHLMRSHFMFLALGTLLVFFTFILSMIACYMLGSLVCQWCALLMLLAAIMVSLGMVTFHVYISIENDDIDDGGDFRANWPAEVEDKTKVSYGYSYIVSWLGVVFCFVGCLVFVKAHNMRHNADRGDGKKLIEDQTRRSNRNRGKPYVTTLPRRNPPSAEPRMMPGPQPVFMPGTPRSQMMPPPAPEPIYAPKPIYVPQPVYGGFEGHEGMPYEYSTPYISPYQDDNVMEQERTMIYNDDV